MKTKSLQFGKAMSAALFVLLLVVVGSKNALAQTQVATLQHGDSISVFYGSSALSQAYSAAVTDDIITLSDGTFTGVNITKAITLRGAGCVWDSISASFPTIVSGDIHLKSTNIEHHMLIEGVFFTGKVYYDTLYYPRFSKCNFNDVTINGWPYMQHAQFINCMLKKMTNFWAYNTSFVNCVIWSLSNASNSTTAQNSFIRLDGEQSNLFAYNCIIANTISNFVLKGNSIAFNCIGICSPLYSVFQGQNYGCITVDSYSDVFETFDGSSFSYLEKFLLKEEIASGFLGTDGTEVGIYGGTAPYNPRPNHMVVKHCNVANKSTIDGKLSVEIEVYTEDE